MYNYYANNYAKQSLPSSDMYGTRVATTNEGHSQQERYTTAPEGKLADETLIDDSASRAVVGKSYGNTALMPYRQSYPSCYYESYPYRSYYAYPYASRDYAAASFYRAGSYASYPKYDAYGRCGTRPATYDYDPLSEMRPGSLAPRYSSGRNSKSDNENAATYFLDNELMPLIGHVHVMYESTRKFGRFDMRDGKLVLDKSEKESDILEELSRLWQMGDGYVYVRHTDEDDDRRGGGSRSVMNVSIFHVDHTTYVKLEPREAAEMVSADPFWSRMKRGDLRYV